MKVREPSSISVRTSGEALPLAKANGFYVDFQYPPIDTVPDESVVPLAQTICLYFFPGPTAWPGTVHC